MKTSNKIILVLILVFVLSPVIAGMVIMQGVKRNVEAGMAYEKKLMKDPLVIRPGDFHALSIELNEVSKMIFDFLVYECINGHFVNDRF